MTASIEGEAGVCPASSPPRTVEHGLVGEAHGPQQRGDLRQRAHDHSARRGVVPGDRTPESPGTKAFALTGNVCNTGLIEVPMGTPLRDIVFDVGGGIPNGKKFKAVQIGGPSGGCLSEKDLDRHMDFDSLTKIGAMIGSGGMVVMDEDTCMVEVARFFMSFTQRESCGKCVPCREGTQRMLEILERIVAGQGTMEDLDTLRDLADMIENTALCGLGKSAPKPVISTLNAFRDEYVAHIRDRRCPAGVAPASGVQYRPRQVQGLLQVCPELPGVGHSRHAEVAVHHCSGRLHPLRKLRGAVCLRRDHRREVRRMLLWDL